MLDKLIAQGQLHLPPSALSTLGAPSPLGTVPFDRVEGMLLGLAIGDSLGNTTEGQLPDTRHPIRGYAPNRCQWSCGRPPRWRFTSYLERRPWTGTAG